MLWGVLEVVRVSRARYPTWYPHDTFKARYYILGYGQAKYTKVMTGEDSEVEWQDMVRPSIVKL